MKSSYKLYSKRKSEQLSTNDATTHVTPIKSSLVLQSDQTTRRKPSKRYENVSEQSVNLLMNQLQTLGELIKKEYRTFIQYEKNNIKMRSQNRLLKEQIQRANQELKQFDPYSKKHAQYTIKVNNAKQAVHKIIKKVERTDKELLGYLKNIVEYLEQDDCIG